MASLEKNQKAIEEATRLMNVPWCEEYEKMISGMPYRSWESPELLNAQSRASKICNELRQVISEGDEVAKESLLLSLLGQYQAGVTLEGQFSFLYGFNTSIGRNFYGNTGLAIDDSAFVTIGDDVIVGPDVHFITINHSIDVAERLRGVMYAKPIRVGGACWIGARATILPGAEIGYGCTIGAGAVVSGHIPDYSVAVGSPARVVKSVAPPTPLSEASNRLEPSNVH